MASSENNLNNTSDRWSFTLCGRNGSCCPVVTQTGADEFTIVDDFGGSVKLTSEQVSLMQTVIDRVDQSGAR